MTTKENSRGKYEKKRQSTYDIYLTANRKTWNLFNFMHIFCGKFSEAKY